jgi:peptidoglycan hydrolase-like protein with peptidoglycan-binding domain
VLGSAAVVAGGIAAGAGLAWPQPRLAAGGAGLARLTLSRLAGPLEALDVRGADGKTVPVRLVRGDVVPARTLPAGERLTVTATVRRPSWAGWLVGRSVRRSVVVETPVVRVLDRWLQVRAGTHPAVAFDRPVRLVAIGDAIRRLRRPEAIVALGTGAAAGTTRVAAAARPWERLSTPVAVTWFPSRRRPQVLAAPDPARALAPTAQLRLTFSAPVADVLGGSRPRLVPPTPGTWRRPDSHTLVFRPRGLGFGLGSSVRIVLPAAVRPTTLRWSVAPGSTLRLQQVLAQLGYLPLAWRPHDDPPTTLRGQLAAAVAPPPGRFRWRYANTPVSLRALWSPGRPNEITRAAVMTFEDANGLAVDGIAGPQVWRTLLRAAAAGRRHAGGYSYVFVHRDVPQSLNLWHDGQVVLSSPGNTGVPEAPTPLGTWPVFEHIPVGTMSGTNPDGSHYDDPGIQYISYFHGGDAIHAFNRASYGTPQSLGCVELPLAAAARVWPYTPIGTLVTIEN